MYYNLQVRNGYHISYSDMWTHVQRMHFQHPTRTTQVAVHVSYDSPDHVDDLE